jgi:opine dehydrogenase
MNISTVAILGAGNGGLAAAADLTLRGHDVRLFSRSEGTLTPIRERGGIELIEGQKKDSVKIGMTSTRLDEVAAGADVIMICAPAVGHAGLAAALAPLIEPRQILLLNPGHTGGSLHVAAILRGSHARPNICETVTLTYICRTTGPARVEIYSRTKNLKFAAFPGRATTDLARAIAALYPAILPVENVLETGLSNINAIMHPAGMIANADKIRAGEEFYFYCDVTPAIARVIEGVDRERLAIVKRLGLPPLSFVELFHRAGLTSDAALAAGSVYQAMRESEPNRTIKAPRSLDHRYLHEDVGYGLVPMAEIGTALGIETPIINGLVSAASQMNNIDYRREGLTLEKMGLGGIAAGELKTLVREGF